MRGLWPSRRSQQQGFETLGHGKFITVQKLLSCTNRGGESRSREMRVPVFSTLRQHLRVELKAGSHACKGMQDSKPSKVKAEPSGRLKTNKQTKKTNSKSCIWGKNEEKTQGSSSLLPGIKWINTRIRYIQCNLQTEDSMDENFRERFFFPLSST